MDLHDLLDDQQRNTNMNDKDHLVGQLTRQEYYYLDDIYLPVFLEKTRPRWLQTD